MTRRLYFITALSLLLYATAAFAHVELNYPEGGETFTAGDTITIRWTEVQSHLTLNWEIYFSPDASQSWIEVSNNIAVPAREYQWIVPAIVTEQGRIRVVQNNDEEQDYQDVSANFTILAPQSAGELSSPLSGMNLFPNPAIHFCQVSFTLHADSEVELGIYDGRGTSLEQHPYPNLPPGEHTISLDVSGYPKGTYLVILRAEGIIRSRKLIVGP